MTVPTPPAAAAPAALPADLRNNPRMSQWVGFTEDGMLEIRAGKVELGQGVWTMLLLVAADELEVAPSALRLTVGDTARCPDQGLTAGSLSTEVGAMALRLVCAEVRQRFAEAAARRWGVQVESVQLADGRFHAPGQAGLSYAELAGDVDLAQTLRGDGRPKPPEARRHVGNSLPRPDLLRKLFGAGFIHDLRLPGMLHGRVVPPPTAAVHTLHLDEAVRRKVLSLPGVHTLHVDGRYLAVAAEREEQAVAAAEVLRAAARWDSAVQMPTLSADQAWLRQLPCEHSVVLEDAPAPLPAAQAASSLPPALVFEADYSRPFLLHASIGPSCALAQWDDGRLTVWTHSQGVFPLRRELANFFGIGLEAVAVIHADGAGCYGHNGADDAAVDAAILARACGRPVRVQWSRQDEFGASPAGSAMSVRVAATLDEHGRIQQWSQDIWSQTHVQRPVLPQLSCLASRLREPPAPTPPLSDFPLPAGGGQRNAVPLYDVGARRIHYHLVKTPVLRTSAIRGLGAYANVFAIESAMDELAALAGRDALEFRLAHLQDERAATVLSRAAQAAGWTSPLPPARREGAVRGRGLALARYKYTGAYCAVVIEIEVSDHIALERVWVAVDAGEVIHPDGLVNQVEGGVLQAASWTLKEAARVGPQGIETRTWEDYPILGFDELPRTLDVQVIERPDEPPLGVGECAAGPTAAALANALHDALGIRARHLPLTPERLMALIQQG